MTLPTQQTHLTLLGEKDHLFEFGPYPRPFEFNGEVARVFDDMISRSVPLYREVNHALVEWACLYQQDGGVVYDIGCSTGTTLLAVGTHLPRPAHLVGLDTSQPMLDRAKAKLEVLGGRHRVSLLCQSALDCAYQDASFVILNYTLQFIPVAQRSTLLRKIAAGMRPGGILFMSEKVRSSCPEFQETITRAYENFKLRAGYSQTEIARKKEALDQVLVPLTLAEQMEMLFECGFAHVEPLMKWNNFASIVAMKR